MSLEVAITENTAAIRELIAAMSLRSPGAIAYAEAKAKVLEPAEPTPEPVLEKPKAKRAEKAAPVAEVTPEPPAPSALTYEDIRGPFLTQLVAKKGREEGAALLAEFGVPAGGKLSDIPEARWSDVLAAINARAAS